MEKMTIEKYWLNQAQGKRLNTCNHYRENTFILFIKFPRTKNLSQQQIDNLNDFAIWLDEKTTICFIPPRFNIVGHAKDLVNRFMTN